GLAVGSPTNMGVLSWRMKRFWDEAMFDHWGQIDGKVACAFSSSGGWGGGAEIACQSLLMVLMNFGFLVFGVTDYAGKMTTCHYGAVAAREPRDADVAGACRSGWRWWPTAAGTSTHSPSRNRGRCRDEPPIRRPGRRQRRPDGRHS